MDKQNVRIVGKMTGSVQIWIEDYAYTYLKRLSEEGRQAPLAAVLIGKRDQAMFVYGAIELAMDVRGEDNAEAWTQVYSEIQHRFPGQELLGWAYVGEESSPEENAWLPAFHMEHFPAEGRVFFYCDPAELAEGAYLFCEGKLEQQSGYGIFYERNEAMQTLLVERNQKRQKEDRHQTEAAYIRRVQKPFGLPKPSQRPEQGQKGEPVSPPEQKSETERNESPGVFVASVKGRLTPAGSYFAGILTAAAIIALCLVAYPRFETLQDVMQTTGLFGKQTDSLQNREDAGRQENDTNQYEQTTIGRNSDDTKEGIRIIEEEADARKENGVLEVETLPGGIKPRSSAEEESEEPKQNKGTVRVIEEQDEQEENNEQEEPERKEAEESPDEQEEDSEGEQVSSDKGDAAAVTSSIRQSYVVQPGDNLTAICQRQYGNLKRLEEVMEVNGIVDANSILVGDILILP